MAAVTIVRFGVLAGMVCHFAVAFLLMQWPITMDFTALYAGLGATAGRKLFSGDWMSS